MFATKRELKVARRLLEADIVALREEANVLRYLIAQANSDHAKERDTLHREIDALRRAFDARTGHLA